MKILAFDISSVSTGVSVINNSKLVKSSCQLITTSPKQSYGQRLSFFEAEIKSLIKKYKPDRIIIEEIFKGRNIVTFKVLSYFRAVALKAIYEEIGTDPISLTASEVRSFLGIKNTKEDTFAFIKDKYNLKSYNFEEFNDITDSIALGLAVDTMIKKGIDEKSIRSPKRKRKKRRRRNKKGVSKTGT